LSCDRHIPYFIAGPSAFPDDATVLYAATAAVADTSPTDHRAKADETLNRSWRISDLGTCFFGLPYLPEPN